MRARRIDGGTCELRECEKCGTKSGISHETNFVDIPGIPTLPFAEFMVRVRVAESKLSAGPFHWRFR